MHDRELFATTISATKELGGWEVIISQHKSLAELYSELCVRFRELHKILDRTAFDDAELEKVDCALKFIEGLQKIEV